MSLYQFMTPIKRKKPADENQDPLQSSKKAKPGDSVSKRKQACAYRHEWPQGRETWLYYRQDEGMYCKLCQKYNKRPFDRDTWNKTPCRRLRLGSVKEHEQSAGHLDALKLELLSTTSHNIAEVIQPEVGHDTIVSAFKCLYFLAKRRIPHVANFEPLLDLLTQLGLTVKDDLHVAKNATYCSDHSVREMLHFLSSTMEDDTIQRVQKSDFFSIMLDETTDVSVEEQLTLNCRFLDESGQLSVKFLKIIQPLNSKCNDEPNHLPTVSLNAETIARHVTSYFAEYGLNFDNLVGIGTDGGAVMTGKHNGVVKRLQQVATSAIGIHCCAHRLQLASTQAAGSVPFVKKFTTIVRQLYDYFNNSAVRMAGLHAVQTALDQSVLNPIEPSSTRWLSMEASVRRLKDTFVSVLISLEREGEERGDAKAIGLFHLMSTYRFISTMLLLCDLLPHVSNLSKALQASNFEHSLVKPLVLSTVSTLRQLKTVDGENLRSLPDLLDTLEKSDVTVKQHADDHDFFTEHVKGKYIDRLMSNIEQRFPSEDVGLLSHFAIFDPHRMQVNQTADYGQEEVKSLSEHFLQKPDQPNVTADAVNEWTNFRNFAKDSVLKQPDLKAQSIIDLLCTKSVAQHAFPHLSKLAKIYRVLPCHTADAERTFSQLKIIKTVPRNRLNQASLDGLIRIAVDGPPVHEFDYQSTVQRWAQKKNRRLCRK